MPNNSNCTEEHRYSITFKTLKTESFIRVALKSVDTGLLVRPVNRDDETVFVDMIVENIIREKIYLLLHRLLKFKILPMFSYIRYIEHHVIKTNFISVSNFENAFNAWGKEWATCRSVDPRFNEEEILDLSGEE